jgi:hypothetical protein
MALPKGQKAIVLPNNAASLATIQDYLLNGFVIQIMVNLSPVSNNILIIYAEPPDAPPPV